MLSRPTFFGHESDGGLFGDGGFAVEPAEDPLEHADIVAKAGPQELPLLRQAEPVHVVDLWRLNKKQNLTYYSAALVFLGLANLWLLNVPQLKHQYVNRRFAAAHTRLHPAIQNHWKRMNALEALPLTCII